MLYCACTYAIAVSITIKIVTISMVNLFFKRSNVYQSIFDSGLTVTGELKKTERDWW